jgi:integrase
MSRRSGQTPKPEKHGKNWTIRYWIDVPGEEQRAHRRVIICPVAGPGAMTKSERERRAKEIIQESGADTKEHFNRVVAGNLGVTLREQAKRWIEHVQTRKRRRVNGRTVEGWQYCLNKWLLPDLGEMPIAEVSNGALRELVGKMSKAGLSPGSINAYVKVVKLVIASAVDENGDQIYPRKWNHEFIDLPEIKDPRQPCFTSEQVTAVVAAAGGQYQMLFALLAGSGLRVSESLGLEVGKHISKDCSTLYVRQQVWGHTVVPSPKTAAGFRDVDLCPSLAAMLKAFMASRTDGFLFHTKTGKPISPESILTWQLHPAQSKLGLEQCGFHAFRRFRTTWLRKNSVPEDLIRFWLGHATRSVTDGYSKLKEDVEFRKLCAEKAGLGFELPIVPNVPKPEHMEYPVST